MKIVALNSSVEFDQIDVMLFYFKDMYENSRLVFTLDYVREDNSSHITMV